MLYVTRDLALLAVCQYGRLGGAVLVAALCALSCARSGLYPGEVEEPGEGHPAVGGSAALAGAGGGPSPVQPSGGSTNGAEPLDCEPSPEQCNGLDDDCDGVTDDLAAEPCPGGGSRFCVGGRFSECPRRCEQCVPGSTRICQNSFCSFWGEQECAADGQGFGPCQESLPPAECRAIAQKFEDSRELLQCCVDNGYCCLDQFDLDGDDDRREMLGNCGDVACR